MGSKKLELQMMIERCKKDLNKELRPLYQRDENRIRHLRFSIAVLTKRLREL